MNIIEVKVRAAVRIRPVSDYIADRSPVLHRHPEIAPHRLSQPLVILYREGLIKPVLGAQVYRLVFGYEVSLRLQLSYVSGYIVARRKLNDGERDDRDRPGSDESEYETTRKER